MTQAFAIDQTGPVSHQEPDPTRPADDDLTLTAGDARARISPAHGARLAELVVGAGALVTVYSATRHGWGSFPMAPWAGRVRNGTLTWRGRSYQLEVLKPPHAMHGVVSDERWQVLQVDTAGARLRRDFGERWPWPGHAEIEYRLAADHLAISLEVYADETEMPAWCGLHPWFPRQLREGEASVRLTVDADALLVRDADGLPDGRRRPPPADLIAVGVDDCFEGVRWPVRLTWPGLELTIEASHSWAVIFTGRPEAVCVEPQTAPPDATALGAEQVAAPGAPVRLESVWRWTLH